MSAFEEYWRRLFAGRTVAFVRDATGRTIPVRESDKRIAQFFWSTAIARAQQFVSDGDEPMEQQ